MVDAFWDQFEEAGAKIDSLARDKRLHDDFQRAQDLFRIMTDRKRELIQESSRTEGNAEAVEARWRQLEKAFNGLQVELATAHEHALDDAGDSPPPAWLGMLDKAEALLAQGVRELNVELVKKGTNALTMVIQKVPTRLNKSLVEKAKSLALDKLVKPQRDILAHLEKLDFDKDARERIEEFATGVQALERLNDGLERLLWNHDSMQTVDDQLQPLDEGEAPELARIQMAWEFVADPLRALKPSKWMLTLKLDEIMDALGKAIGDYEQAGDKAAAERAIRRSFDKFRPVVAQGLSPDRRRPQSALRGDQQVWHRGQPTPATPAMLETITAPAHGDRYASIAELNAVHDELVPRFHANADAATTAEVALFMRRAARHGSCLADRCRALRRAESPELLGKRALPARRRGRGNPLGRTCGFQSRLRHGSHRRRLPV